MNYRVYRAKEKLKYYKLSKQGKKENIKLNIISELGHQRDDVQRLVEAFFDLQQPGPDVTDDGKFYSAIR